MANHNEGPNLLSVDWGADQIAHALVIHPDLLPESEQQPVVDAPAETQDIPPITIARTELSSHAQLALTSPDTSITTISSSSSSLPPSDSTQHMNGSTVRSHTFSSNESSSPQSSVPVSSRPVNISGATVSASISFSHSLPAAFSVSSHSTYR
ncbi:hypothetical protein BGW80DRAFT_549339 [Lactifluus volemus]|nr:hypothetical protein BGW80DRAFT_549339 [Lactifluus volemus]